MTNEKIDDLRRLLDLPDRSAVSLVMLNGIVETTRDRDSARTFAESGDQAFVIVGPKDKLDIVRREDKETGRITYTFTMPEATA